MNPELKPYQQSGTSKKAEVSTMFNKIAKTYDFLNHFLSAGIDFYWRRKTIEVIKNRSNIKILDMATGTGDLAFEALKQISNARIIGLDIADQMIEIAKTKAIKKGVEDHTKFDLGDAENIALNDGEMDVVTSGFGVRNFQDLDQGLKEFYRVTKVGGQLVVLEFSIPKNYIFNKIYHFYFKYILPQIGKITSKDPSAYDYLFRSVQAFPDGEKFVARMEKIGYSGCTYTPMTLGICTIYSGYKLK